MFVFRPLLAFFFFSSLAAAVDMEFSSLSSVSSPRDALVVFQNIMQHSAATVQDVRRPAMMMEDRDLIEDISETCLNETVAALETLNIENVVSVEDEDMSSLCTVSGNSDQTSAKCDVSKFPGVNDAIEDACAAGGYAFVEVTFIMSVDSMKMEFNNMGFCVGSSCSDEEAAGIFEGLSELYGALFSALGGDDPTTPDITISLTLEEPGVDTYTSSSPQHKMLSSFAGGAIAASVGLMFLFLA